MTRPKRYEARKLRSMLVVLINIQGRSAEINHFRQGGKSPWYQERREPWGKDVRSCDVISGRDAASGSGLAIVKSSVKYFAGQVVNKVISNLSSC